MKLLLIILIALSSVAVSQETTRSDKVGVIKIKKKKRFPGTSVRPNSCMKEKLSQPEELKTLVGYKFAIIRMTYIINGKCEVQTVVYKGCHVGFGNKAQVIDVSLEYIDGLRAIVKQCGIDYPDFEKEVAKSGAINVNLTISFLLR